MLEEKINDEIKAAENSTIKTQKDGTNSFALVEFKGHRRELMLNHKNLELTINDKVLVTSETGIDIGKVVLLVQMTETAAVEKYRKNVTKTVVSKATEENLNADYINRCEEEDVIAKLNIIAPSFGLEMKIVDAEWQFDRQKLIIYFIAAQRIDFRELVKELARQFRTRIELRQISAREEVKRVGCGVGCCGQKLCCTAFLFDFNKVTTEQAKVQQLSNNISKLSGNCKRLKCCVFYEYEIYAEKLKKYPPINSIIELKDLIFILNKIDIFKENVSLYNQKEKKYETLTYQELEKLIKSGKVIPPKVEEESKRLVTVEDDVIIEDDF